ncbi:MAG: primosomal protein N' [candidate division Zixibacteria bacterium]|jgi:primosomal protein N' (replication factor Y)|nr:primosomal protein N' [candidate division Zixibacteria bacterium]
MPSTTRFARIAVSGPLRRTFTYAAPESLEPLAPGQRVLVPFGRSTAVGYYLEPADPVDFEVRRIRAVVDHETLIPPELVRLCQWMADYYFANPADCLALTLPPQLRTKRPVALIWGVAEPAMLPPSIARLVKAGQPLSGTALNRIRSVGTGYLDRLRRDGVVVEDIHLSEPAPKRRLIGFRLVDPERWRDEIFRRVDHIPPPFHGIRSAADLRADGVTDHYRKKALDNGVLEAVYDDTEPRVLDFVLPRDGLDGITLTEQQQQAFAQVRDALDTGYAPFLLHGITGSGKTIVYCHLARDIIQRGRTALVLTPEIALSSNTLAYFRGLFGDLVTILHSAMTPAERIASWQGIRAGRYPIVVGPRSALFAPLEKLGLIIVDEEHDESYKQDEPSPRFHGRDAAVMRAKIANIPVVLGSASPSLESYHNARTGRYRLLTITERPAGARLPTVRLVDMRTRRLGGDLPFVSVTLKTEVQQHLSAGRQVILFLNRRGYAPYLKCAECGHVPECPDCQVRLTYHKTGSRLACHYCGRARTDYSLCEKCGGAALLCFGAGTQKVEESVQRLFTDARAVRLDSDTASGRTGAHRILSDFAARKYNLLLGTQMVTKGLDLPDVSLVGVLSADMGMDLPDFRAAERTFSRLVQVAGRSGRSTHPGEVLIQTYYPDHPLLADAARQDYESFYDREIKDRMDAHFPPFVRMVNFIFSSPAETAVIESALRFRDQLDMLAKQRSIDISLLGPAPCAFRRLRGKFRQHLIARIAPDRMQKFVRLLTEWEDASARFSLPGSVSIAVDVDPVDMM